MACKVATTDVGVEGCANSNSAAVSRKRNAVSRSVVISFSIDVCADLLPGVGYIAAPVDAHMAVEIAAIAIVFSSANGDGASVSRKGDAAAGVIGSGFSIDVCADLLPIAIRITLIDAHMAGISAIAVVVWGANGDSAAVSRE